MGVVVVMDVNEALTLDPLLHIVAHIDYWDTHYHYRVEASIIRIAQIPGESVP